MVIRGINMFKKKKDIDNEGLNELIYLGRNILKLLYVMLIIGIICLLIGLGHLIGLFKILLVLLKILSPLFIGFVIAWLFSPLVDKITKKGMPRMLASILVYAIFIILLIVIFRNLV